MPSSRTARLRRNAPNKRHEKEDNMGVPVHSQKNSTKRVLSSDKRPAKAQKRHVKRPRASQKARSTKEAPVILGSLVSELKC